MKKYTAIFMALFIVLAAANGYSYLEQNNEVNQFFLDRKVYPVHTYYYSGSEARPHAIIAIHNDYVLESKLWRSTDITQEKLKRWVNTMTNNSPTTFGIWGRRILGPNRVYLGVWFSPARTASVRLKGNVVNVTTPNRNADRQIGNKFRSR